MLHLKNDGLALDYENFDSEILDSDPILLNNALTAVANSDFVTIKVHGDTSYMKRFNRLEETIRSKGVNTILCCNDEDVVMTYRWMFHGDDEEFELAQTFFTLGGEDNYRGLILWAIRDVEGGDIEVPSPTVPPAQGIYHPGRKDISFQPFLDSIDRSKPIVGIFFYQKQWLTGNLNNIDGLIDAVERKGGAAVPVFLRTYEDERTGSIGIKRILRDFLSDDDGPILDVIVETMSFSQTLIAVPGCGEQTCDENFFTTYGVPVIQAMTVVADVESWKEDVYGLTPSEIAYDLTHPEFDGQIIGVPSASTEKQNDTKSYVCIPDRADRIADIAVMWGKLRHKENRDRRVAVLLYMYPPKAANAGGASGLDTFASVVDLLHRMRDDGYYVGDEIPTTSEELVEILLSGLTNDTSWLSNEDVAERAVDMVPLERYTDWYSELPDSARHRIEKDWGQPPGEFYTVGGNTMIPGKVFGNVIVGFQPDRGRDIQKNYHDPNTVMPHQYLAYYRWLRRVFGADAIIHVGTHGTLEWLPGKSVALSENCCPDYVLDSLPDIYPYIIGNPGEGTQAKRRAAAVIVDHMIPIMTRAGSYDEIEELEGIVQRYMDAVSMKRDETKSIVLTQMRDALIGMNMQNDLGLTPGFSDDDLEERVDDIYDYITEIKENMIKDGLHVLGRPPEGALMCEAVYSLTRLENGDVPSLRGSLARCMGYELPSLLDDPSDRDTNGKLNGEILDNVDEATFDLISAMYDREFDYEECIRYAEDTIGSSCELTAVVAFICKELYPNLIRIGNEMDSVMSALEGGFIPPGPAGCVTRGRAQILPTGRNFYSLDPEAVPWHSSWDIGRRMADQMLERFISEHGTYPRTVGIVVWATDTMKTGGDDIAYILWLMGLRPVWTGPAGRVNDIEVIPLSELGRPRIDVTLRISGLFRDTFPNLVNLIDRGVRLISELDETDEENFLLANIRKEIISAIAEGIPMEVAADEARIRIFGDAPGTYGSGTNILIRTSDWRDVTDIGSIYQSYGKFAYGTDRRGVPMPEAFRRRLEAMDVTVKNSTSREYDMFDNDDVYNDLGGFNAAVRSVRGSMPMSVIGCSTDPDRPRTRTVDEEGRFIFRSKINNPIWLEGLKRHGFKGAEEISNMAEYVLGWDATSDIVDPWMYQSIADRFLFDEETAEWLREVNPYAMYETASRLLEAVGRGMWSPDEETRKQLEEIYLDLEDRFEGMQ